MAVVIDSRARTRPKPKTLEVRVETLEQSTERLKGIAEQQERGLSQHAKQISDLTIAQQRIDSALLALGARMSEFGVIHGRQLDAIHQEIKDIGLSLIGIGQSQARCAQSCQDRYEAELRAERDRKERGDL